MKKQLTIFVFLLSFICGSAFAAKDSLEITPNTSGNCCWTLTVKNRNNQSKSIDEIRFQITTANGTIFEDLKNVTQWTENIFELTASYVAEVSPIPVGGSKNDFGICLGVSPDKIDQPTNVKWVTYNSLIAIDSGTLQFICSPTQSYRNDSVSVVPSVVSNDPVFTFTLFNKNDFAAPISRFATQLVTPSAGTMRPSKISPPSGWKLDSVTSSFAYFSALSPSDYLLSNEVKQGFKVTLRGNPSITKFSFAWFTYDEGGALVSRDTLRNIPVTFTGFVSEADSLKAAVLTGCLYELTVKNYHVSNTIPISKIRRVAIWETDPAVSLTSAPAAPNLWIKTVKADSIIYTAPHDSNAIPSGIVNSLFRFNVDAPLASFKVNWKTFKSLASADSLSSGSFILQCQKEAPKSDDATISDAGLCSYLLKVFNEHNQPPSNLTAVKLSIPAGKGKLSVTFNTLNWNKQSETDTSVIMVAPQGLSQGSGESQDFLFGIEPTTPGEQFPIRWATYDEAAFTAGTPLFSGQHTIGCTPVVSLCDVVTRSSIGQECTNEYSFENLRDTTINRILLEIGNGWTIFTAEAPTGWTTNIIGATKTSVEFTTATVLGIQRDSTFGGFIIKYLKQDTIGKLDTFNVTIKRYDAKDKECVDVLEHICTSTTMTSVAEVEILSTNVTIHPNPVLADATLTLVMETQSRAMITMLDVLGREVRVIGSSILPEGEHQFRISMKGLEEGSYYLRIQTPNGVITKKVVYMP